MHWVIQNNLCNEAGHDRLLEALARRGIPHTLCKVIPFSHVLTSDVCPENPVIAMGTVTLARIAEERGWRPGGLLSRNFDFEVQRAHWGDLLLNAGGIVCSLAEVPEQPRPFFIRPTLDGKPFAGHATDWPSFIAWRDSVLVLTTVTGETRVLVAPLQTLYREARFWIVDGKVVTGSVYKEGTRVVSCEIRRVPYQAVDPLHTFALAIAMRGGMTMGGPCAACNGTYCQFQPARAYCLDVAETPEGPKILEVNCLASAGYYAADMGALVDALESAFGRRFDNESFRRAPT